MSVRPQLCDFGARQKFPQDGALPALFTIISPLLAQALLAILFNLIFKLKPNLHTLKCAEGVQFDEFWQIYMHLWKHHRSQDIEHFHRSPKVPSSPSQQILWVTKGSSCSDFCHSRLVLSLLAFYRNRSYSMCSLVFGFFGSTYSSVRFIHIVVSAASTFLSFFLFLILFIYLFLAALGLRCCARAFSSCGEQGLLFVAVCRLLIVVASLVADHGL